MPLLAPFQHYSISQHPRLIGKAWKTPLRPTATGTFQGMDVVGEARLDPWALTTGASIEF